MSLSPPVDQQDSEKHVNLRHQKQGPTLAVTKVKTNIDLNEAGKQTLFIYRFSNQGWKGASFEEEIWKEGDKRDTENNIQKQAELNEQLTK